MDCGHPVLIRPEAALPIADRHERNIRVLRQRFCRRPDVDSPVERRDHRGPGATRELEAVPIDVAVDDVEVVLLPRDSLDDARHQLCGVLRALGVPHRCGHDRNEAPGRRRLTRREDSHLVAASMEIHPRARQRRARSRRSVAAEQAGTAAPRTRCAAPGRKLSARLPRVTGIAAARLCRTRHAALSLTARIIRTGRALDCAAVGVRVAPDRQRARMPMPIMVEAGARICLGYLRNQHGLRQSTTNWSIHVADDRLSRCRSAAEPRRRPDGRPRGRDPDC